MFSTLALLFIVMPIMELAVLFRVHGALGLDWTLGIVIATGLIGAGLARAQGLMVLRNIQLDMNEGRMPAPRLMDGVMILIAGVLLVTPGLITDTVGFLLLLPPVRFAVRMWLKKKVEEKIANGTNNVTIWRW